MNETARIYHVGSGWYHIHHKNRIAVVRGKENAMNKAAELEQQPVKVVPSLHDFYETLIRKQVQ
jgi:hypothetical protein